MHRFAIPPLVFVLAAACAPAEVQAPDPSKTPTITATRTATPTPTQTPTPTATAPGAVVSGDLRELSLSEPVRQVGAPCGFVDILDFPLDPPDAARASGGRDFGRFRGRFDGYHVGEDWRVGSSSFGQPVYSIAHGRVTYAQPNGWGADKGVVIVEHTFRDRRRFYSMYGHLDPPSVVLRAGQCTERGDQVGNIGDPRSPPHLHFEIRIHMPNTPGPGYWSADLQRAGWRPPSATIWDERIAALPGVQWTYLSHASVLQPLGIVDGDMLTYSSAGEIVALDIENGGVRWSRILPATPNSVLLDAGGGLVYINRSGGTIEAYGVEDLRSGNSSSPIDPLWSAALELAGSYDLVPFPRGGLVAASRSGTTAISNSGEELWHEEGLTGINDWAETGDDLILLDRSGIWLADEGEAIRRTDAINGHRVVASDHPFVYTADAIYGLDLDSRSLELFFDLPNGFPRAGGMSEMPGGGIVLAHTDLDDKRLIAVDRNGSLLWERSIKGLGSRAIELIVFEDQLFMLAQFDIGRSIGVDLFHVDVENGELVRIFSGGTRASNSPPPIITTGDESIIIWIPGVGLSAIKPQEAPETVSGE